MAIGQAGATPNPESVSLRVVPMSGKSRVAGVREYTIENVSVKVCSRLGIIETTYH